jgi:large subunit ribosomal protein L10Ae
MSVDDLKRLNKDKRKKRNLEHRYDVFLASETIIRLIPRLLGPGLGRAGKFPMLLTHNETILDKTQQIKSTLRVQLKKQSIINVAIGHVNMTVEQLLGNLNMSINFIVGLLRKKWQNIEKLYIKSTMGKSHRLY